MLLECHPDAWLMENPGFVSGGNLRWFRDQLSPEERRVEADGGRDAYDLLSEQAAEVPPGSEGVLFLPCMQGAMTPEWNGAALASGGAAVASALQPTPWLDVPLPPPTPVGDRPQSQRPYQTYA